MIFIRQKVVVSNGELDSEDSERHVPGPHGLYNRQRDNSAVPTFTFSCLVVPAVHLVAHNGEVALRSLDRIGLEGEVD
jgi:hypothetical protein